MSQNICSLVLVCKEILEYSCTRGLWFWDQNKYMQKGKHPPIQYQLLIRSQQHVMALPFQSHCWQCAQQLHDRRGDFCQNWAQGVALSKAMNDGISLVICIIPTAEMMKREQISWPFCKFQAAILWVPTLKLTQHVKRYSPITQEVPFS